MTTVINYWGGPGSGKSTRAAEHYVALKKAGHSVELVREYAKDLVYKGEIAETPQAKITGQQCIRQYRLYRKVDFIVTDSPVLIGLVYTPDAPEQVHRDAWFCWNAFTNVNLWLPSGRFAFEEGGRVHNVTQAMALGYEMAHFMQLHALPYKEIDHERPIQLPH